MYLFAVVRSRRAGETQVGGTLDDKWVQLSVHK